MSAAPPARPGPAATTGNRTCAVCGGPLSPRDLLHPVCAAPECRRRFYLDWHRRQRGPEDLARRERAARHRAAAEAEARRLLGAEADAGGGPGPAALPLAVIPAWEPRLTNLPERRRRAFRDHLTRLLSQATAERGGPSNGGEGGAAPEMTAPEVQAVLGRVCAFCQGWCCRSGGDHAYLTVDTLRRYLAAHPGRRPRDVLADYLGRVGHKTYRGSCVYHGPSGCGLPREMQSDTCNDYYCIGLDRFRDDVGEVAPARAAVAAQSEGMVWAVAVIADGETRVVPRPTGQ